MNTINDIINESSNTILSLKINSSEIQKAIDSISSCINAGKKIVLFGNGGSAADSQHIAAEFLGRFLEERKSLPAIALSTDTSTITSLSNDYSYEIIFQRQCESLVESGDVVIGISTSGNSKNVENGLKLSHEKGATTIALLGNNGGKIKDIVDISIIVNSSSTPRIQEAHRTIYHIICELVEKSIIK
jgi:D-sedoheptulose 7-phosphate isomerase